MPAFCAKSWSRRRSSTGRPPLAAEGGFALIEVIVSAMLVGLIVVGTLTGFSVVDRVSADERFHNQAATLAGESQEQLRSDPASTLQTLEAGHSYPQAIGGTTYTITQRTELQPASGSNAACSVTENKRQSGNAFRITSTVTWPQQQKAKRVPVVASSIVTPPTGSALEVDAGNDPTVTAGVSGITATVKYTPVGSVSAVTLEHTTGTEGCVVFGGIPSTAATVEIGELSGYFTRAGVNKYPTKAVTIAPNYTTHYPILYNRGGAIKAEFTYKGEPKLTHANNEATGNIEETVTADTFVAFNALMEAAPDYEVGSTRYAAPTTVYNPLPSSSSAAYEAAATSPSNLFPFASSEAPWSAYAGDCVQNNPKEVTAGVVKPSENIFVAPGGTTSAPKVPTSLVTLNLYKGTEAEVNAIAASKRWENLEITTARPVTITNPKCAGTTPNNESAVGVKHKQETTTGKPNGGHLLHPFLPFGTELELCVYVSPNSYTRKYKDTEAKGPVLPIYIKQKSTQEKTALRIKEEKTEQETQETRERTEATNKNNAETLEETELKQWEKERREGKISETTLNNRKTTQKNNRITRENTEKTNRKTAETAETATETARHNKEAAEATEATKSEVTVETSAECP